MSSEPPSQTLTAASARPRGARRHIVVVHGEHSEIVELPQDGDVVFGRTNESDIRVSDRTLSRRHLRISVGRTVRVYDLDSHNGTRLRGRSLRPGSPAELVSGDVLEAGNTTLLFRDERAAEVVDEAGAWSSVQALAQRVRSTGLNATVIGPSGAGRRSVGEVILGVEHQVIEGRRVDQATVEHLGGVESPLLVLHVDEVASSVQPALARVLAAHTGRIVTTAAHDTGVLAAKLEFYLPLHRTLSGVVLTIPKLDDCHDEFEVIADHVLRRWALRAGVAGVPRVSKDALAVLRARSWPGELRAFAATLEASVVGLAGPAIGAADLRFPSEFVAAGDGKALERQRIEDALAACGGNQTKAAKLLKMSRRTFVSRLDEYGIARPRKRIESTKS